MNERIRDLAKRAGLKMCGCGCDMPTRESAKFAELIIRECLEKMGSNISGTFDSDWDFDTQVKYVKKYFGIQ